MREIRQASPLSLCLPASSKVSEEELSTIMSKACLTWVSPSHALGEGGLEDTRSQKGRAKPGRNRRQVRVDASSVVTQVGADPGSEEKLQLHCRCVAARERGLLKFP